MTWNQTTADPMTKLNHRIRDWEAKGIGYWIARVAEYDAKVRAADNAGTLRRMLEQRDMATVAVYALERSEG